MEFSFLLGTATRKTTKRLPPGGIVLWQRAFYREGRDRNEKTVDRSACLGGGDRLPFPAGGEGVCSQPVGGGNGGAVPQHAVPEQHVKADLSDAAKEKRALFAPAMKQGSWKCVYAESDEEFEALWNEMVTTCKGYGYDDVVAEKVADIQKCLAFIAENNK